MDVPDQQPEDGTLAHARSNVRFSVDTAMDDAYLLKQCFLAQKAVVHQMADTFRDAHGRPSTQELEAYFATLRPRCGCSKWCKDRNIAM